MKINKGVAAGVAAVIIISVLFIFSNKLIKAEEGSDTAAILAKVDEILNNQKSIMQDLSSLKQEVNIVKIRVTQAQ